MTAPPPPPGRAPRRPTALGLVAGLAVLVSLAALAVSLYGIVRQSATAPLEIQLPYVLAAGGGAIVAAVLALVRNMSASDVLEAACDALAGLLALVGAILKGIWSWLLGLLGLD
jgi:hypothetical protein